MPMLTCYLAHCHISTLKKLLLLFDNTYTAGADNQKYSGQYQHIYFRSHVVRTGEHLPPKEAATIWGTQIVPLNSPR